MINTLLYIISLIGQIYISFVLLRFLLQAVHADFYNPISQFIVKVTHPLLKPLRKIIPSIGRQDTASLILAYLLQLFVIIIKIVIISIVSTAFSFSYIQLPILALIELLDLIFYLLYLLLIGNAILSWIAPDSRSSAAVLINKICNTLLAPLRRIIPPIGIFDITPIVALLILFVINNFIIRMLASYFIGIN